MKPHVFISFTSLAMSVATGPAFAAPPDLSVGNPFPDLVLPSLDGGRAMSIADFRGKKVILHVFASW